MELGSGNETDQGAEDGGVVTDEVALPVAMRVVPVQSNAMTSDIYRSVIHFTVNKVELKLTAPWKTGRQHKSKHPDPDPNPDPNSNH